MTNTKEEWKEKRDDTELGLRSMVQGIGQIFSHGVLTEMEKAALYDIDFKLENIGRLFESRNLISKEAYCDPDNRG